MNDVFPSKYLKAEDLEEGETRVLTIERVDLEKLGQGEDAETKPVAYFVESEKGLALNKTNFSVIIKALNEPDTINWTGKKIAIHVMEVQFKNDIVQAIRVKTRAPASAGVVGGGVNVPSKKLANVEDVAGWNKLVAESIKRNYVTAERASETLLAVVFAAGIETVDTATLKATWNTIVNHYVVPEHDLFEEGQPVTA